MAWTFPGAWVHIDMQVCAKDIEQSIGVARNMPIGAAVEHNIAAVVANIDSREGTVEQCRLRGRADQCQLARLQIFHEDIRLIAVGVFSHQITGVTLKCNETPVGCQRRSKRSHRRRQCRRQHC